jgi:hypothetical protein
MRVPIWMADNVDIAAPVVANVALMATIQIVLAIPFGLVLAKIDNRFPSPTELRKPVREKPAA